MGENLFGLAAEDDRSDAVPTVRGHDDKVAAFRPRGIDDRPIGMFMLDLNFLACDACCLRRLGGGSKKFSGHGPSRVRCTDPTCPQSSAGRSSTHKNMA